MLHSRLTQIDGIDIGIPQGAFYLFPSLTRFIPDHLNGDARNKYIFELLLEHGVAVVYGSCFGRHFGDNIRFSYSATNVDQINIGMDRFEQVLEIAQEQLTASALLKV